MGARRIVNRGVRRLGLGVVVALLAPAGTALADTPAERLAAAAGDVTGATASRFGALDDQGASLDGLKVIQAGGTYLGVYHAVAGPSFAVHLATSTDLLHWTRRATLDTDSSQATIEPVPGGGFLVAYEKGFTADVLPVVGLPPQLSTVQGLIGRARVRLRYYRTLATLLTGHPARQFTAPRTLALTAEGTPDIQSVTLKHGRIGRSTITLGLHYFANTTGDLFPDADRQATATLTNFLVWKEQDAAAINTAFLTTPRWHAGFTGPPTGNFGDRDGIVLDGAPLALHETQYTAGRFATWRLFLRETDSNRVTPLEVRTPGGSRAFGNPTVTAVTDPAGRPALLFSMFVFSEAAAPGEAGELVFYRER